MSQFGLAVRLVSRSSVPLPFSLKVVVCGHCLATLLLTINETLKWLWTLPLWMQESFWWRQCSVGHSLTFPHFLGSWPLPVPQEMVLNKVTLGGWTQMFLWKQSFQQTGKLILKRHIKAGKSKMGPAHATVFPSKMPTTKSQAYYNDWQNSWWTLLIRWSVLIYSTNSCIKHCRPLHNH